MSEPREQLRQVNAAAEEATHVARRALSDASKARQRLDEAKAGLEVFASLDADITASTVEQLKRDEGFAYTGNVPKEMDLPGHLRDRSRAYTSAKERVLRLEAAVTVLDADAEAASAAATQAAHTAEAAAARVAASEAEPLADELERCELQAQALRSRLLALGETWVTTEGGRHGPVALSARVIDLIRTPPVNPPASADERARWALFIKSLLENPDTTVPATVLADRPKPPTPLAQPPGIPWPEHQRILQERHAERVKGIANRQAEEQQQALAVHRAAVAKVREAGRKSIAS